jgi:glycosyltransferase involved in cell wall biosynthesis
MRMLVSAPFDTSAQAGISLYVRRIVPQLARYCQLTILTPEPHLVSEHGRAIRIPDSVRFRIRRLTWVLTRLPAYCTDDFDVLLCLTPAVPVPALLPTIAVVHDLTPLKVPGLNPITEKVSFLAGIQTLRFADGVVTDSRSTMDDFATMHLLSRRRSKVAFCGPGISPSCGEADYARQFVPFVLYVGSHAPHKNVIRLIHSFARVRAERDLKLVLVGSGSEEQLGGAAQAVAKHGLQARVTMLNSISDARLSSLYTHCRLLACPSLYEGFGLPVLEAMLHGAPVACSSVSSLPEVAGNAAILFNPLSVQDMADKLQVLVGSPGLAARLSNAGRHRATLFTWERTASTIYESASALTATSGRKH